MKKHLLIVEDDVFLREMYVHIFEKSGYKVDQAEDGLDGVNKAVAKSYDLILLDIMIPKKSGLEVLQSLRRPSSKANETPIILLTNLGQESIIREAYNMGADGFILKSDLLPQQVVDKVTQFMKGEITKEDFLITRSLD